MRRYLFTSLGLVWCCSAVCGLAADNTPPDQAPSVMTLVRRALDSDVAGHTDQRAALLQQALSQSPFYAPARWHNGELLVTDRWMPLVQAQQEAARNARLKEYRRLRDSSDDSIAAHAALAAWCRKQQWRDREVFHWREVLALQPGHKDAVAALHLQSFQGKWLTLEEIALYKDMQSRAARNFQHWQGILSQLRDSLASENSTERREAELRLREIREPAAIAALTHALAQPSEEFAAGAIAALQQMDGQAATDVLTWQAVTSPHAEVRQAAIEALKSRPWHSYVPTLMGSLTSPLELTYYINSTSPGDLKYGYELFRDGIFSQAALTSTTNSEIYRTSNTPLVAHPRYTSERTAQIRTALNERGLMQQQVDAANRVTQWQNDRLYAVLKQTTGETLAATPQAWWTWWEEYNGLYLPDEKPVRSSHSYRNRSVRLVDWTRSYGGVGGREVRAPAQPVANADRRAVHGNQRRLGQASHHGCCFAPGTLVWTEAGLEPIERLRAGDRVVSQDPETGELAFCFVREVAARPATQTRRIVVGGDTVVATLGHPFWAVGKGWRMCKQLQSSDRLYSISGCVAMDELGAGPEWEAYSLTIEDFGTYFVGKAGLLVKDNILAEANEGPVPGYEVVAGN